MYAAKSSCLPPEDLAIRAAQAVATFQAELEGTTPIIHASDVFVIGSNWRVIVDSLRAPDEGIKRKPFGFEIDGCDRKCLNLSPTTQ